MELPAVRALLLLWDNLVCYYIPVAEDGVEEVQWSDCPVILTPIYCKDTKIVVGTDALHALGLPLLNWWLDD